MTSDEHARNKLVARYWCDKMRALLRRDAPSETKAQQLSLPGIWEPTQWRPNGNLPR